MVERDAAPAAPGTIGADARAIMQFEAEKKSLAVAYLLWFFLGSFGAHRFSMGRMGSAIAMLVLSLLGWALAGIYVGFIFLPIVGLWWVLDLFLLPGIVRDHNRTLLMRLGAI